MENLMKNHDMDQEFKTIPPWNKAKFTEKLMILVYRLIIIFPVMILLGIILTIHLIYLQMYLLPMLSNDTQYFWQFSSDHTTVLVEFSVVTSVITLNAFWLFVSFYKAATTTPGSIPATWESCEDSDSTNDSFIEKRLDGSLRICRHCSLIKPDRSHHCKQCGRCILKMDHHCNWIGNCVGCNNYKYFYLVVFYSALSLDIFIATFWEVVVKSIQEAKNPDFWTVLLTTTYSLSVLLGFVMNLFFAFHTWMAASNYTTIEYCEKRRKGHPGYSKSPFSKGVMNNLKDTLGENILLWPLPFGFKELKFD